MPVFEFECEACGRRFSALVGVVMDTDATGCPNCGSEKIRRLISRISKVRSEDARLDELADKVEGMGEPGSYREMRDVVREAGAAMDEDVSDEMEEMFESDLSED